MACISVGSLVLAIKQLGVLPVDTEDLVAISQVSLPLYSSTTEFFHEMLIQVYINNIENWQTSRRIDAHVMLDHMSNNVSVDVR
jgi:hypothetical protein